MLLSIIMPIYKTQEYLREAVDSILIQTFNDYEVILVDDGSPDKCPEICDEYAGKYSNIYVIHKENGGLSDARNSGLKVAKGDYVIFMDSDDFYLSSDFFKEIADAINNSKADMIVFQRTEYIEDKGGLQLPPKPYDQSITDNIDFNIVFPAMVRQDKLDISASLRAIKKSILIENDLFFKKGIYSEDVEWYTRILQFINTVQAINKPFYGNRKRAGSITHNTGEKNVADLYYAIDSSIKIIRAANLIDEIEFYALGSLAYQYYILLGMFSLLPKNTKNNYLKQIKNLSCITNYSVNNKTAFSRFVFRFLGFKLSSIFFGYYVKRKRS